MLGIGLELTGCGLGGGGSGTPSLDLNFLTMTADTLDSRVTFSRTSLAWQYDSTGTLVTVPHNLILDSETLTAWTKTRATITSNILANPVDSAITADKMVEATDVATTRNIQQTVSVVSGNTYTMSVYAKSAERTAINLRFGSGFAAGNVTFDLNAGTLTSSGAVASSSITAVGAAGWYRCFCAFVCTSSVSAGAQIFLSSGGTITYDGVSGNGVYLWGAQSAQHTALRPYLNTSVKNLLGFSEDYSNAAFVKTSSSITTNAATAPNSTTTADKLIVAAANATHFVYQNVTVTSGATYTHSVYLKAAEYTTATVYLNDSTNLANRVGTVVDLATGVLSSTASAGTFSGAAATATSMGSDWWRIGITGVVGIATVQCRVFAGAASAYLGDGTSGIYIWGSQLAASGSVDTYVPTIGAAPSSAAYHGPVLAYDPTTLLARGLRSEETRTNLVPGTLTGGTFWSVLNTTATAGATAPDGTANAVTLTGSAGGVTNYGLSLIGASLATITPSVPTTASVFVKAGTAPFFRLILCDNSTPTIGAQAYLNTATMALGTVGTQSGAPTSVSATIQQIGSAGWYRLTLTATLGAATTASALLRMTSANGTTTDTGSNTVVVFNPQLETNAAFASSPILTTSAAITRAADIATMAPLGSWYNATEGTILVEVEVPSQTATGATTGVSFGFSDTLFNNATYVNHPTTSDAFNVQNGGVGQVSSTLSSPPLTVKKVAAAYKVNDFALVRNGGSVTTDTSGSVSPAATQARIGSASWGSGGNQLNGYIRKVKIWPARRSNGEIQNLTT